MSRFMCGMCGTGSKWIPNGKLCSIVWTKMGRCFGFVKPFKVSGVTVKCGPQDYFRGIYLFCGATTTEAVYDVILKFPKHPLMEDIMCNGVHRLVFGCFHRAVRVELVEARGKQAQRWLGCNCVWVCNLVCGVFYYNFQHTVHIVHVFSNFPSKCAPHWCCV